MEHVPEMLNLDTTLPIAVHSFEELAETPVKPQREKAVSHSKHTGRK